MSELRQRISSLAPEKRALLEQRLMKKGLPETGEHAIARRKGKEPCALSFCQQRLWFLDQLSPGTGTYNVPNAMRIEGPLHIEALQRSLDVIVGRHEVLRTTFDCIEGSPVQVVMDRWPALLRVIDLRETPAAARAGRMQRILEAEAGQPFNLSRDLMLRATVLRLADREYLFLLVTHHVAWDLKSRFLLYQELTPLYEAFSKGWPVVLPELAIQYADYALWQRRHLQGEKLQKLIGYWKEQLAGAPPHLELPADFARPAVQSLQGGKYFFFLPAELLEPAKDLSRAEKVTLFMTLLAAFKVFLFAYTGQEDLCVGSPIAGRNRVETEALIGFFINTLVLRTKLSANSSFRELLRRVREVTLEAYAHQDLPFEKLVEVLRPPRDLSRNPLFQVNFRVANALPTPLALPGLAITPLELIDNATSKFDLALELGTAQGTSSYWEYSTDLFQEPTIARMTNDFVKLLAALVAHPDMPLQQLDVLTQLSERRLARHGTEQRAHARPRMRSFPDVRRKVAGLAQSGDAAK